MFNILHTVHTYVDVDSKSFRACPWQTPQQFQKKQKTKGPANLRVGESSVMLVLFTVFWDKWVSKKSNEAIFDLPTMHEDLCHAGWYRSQVLIWILHLNELLLAARSKAPVKTVTDVFFWWLCLILWQDHAPAHAKMIWSSDFKNETLSVPNFFVFRSPIGISFLAHPPLEEHASNASAPLPQHSSCRSAPTSRNQPTITPLLCAGPWPWPRCTRIERGNCYLGVIHHWFIDLSRFHWILRFK